MMSKSQWFALLCLFWIYLLVGAFIFFFIESQEELKRLTEQVEEREILEEMVNKYFKGNKADNKSLENLFNRLTDYCGKPINPHMSKDLPDLRWDFYHSLFFVITVVSTIGYGNLAPTIMLTRILMIFYGLIGIPINGIVMVTLGEYFAKSFKKLYLRWKNTRIEQSYAKFGLVGQIILYAVPGLTFFIFLPATIISVFERWDYDVSVYYTFVTLTTIGFGDYVAGVTNVNDFSPTIVAFYQLFLLVWIIGGLGYVVMIIGFITQGMRSRRIRKIEKVLAENIKRTPQKIRNEFRALLHEFLFVRVKPVYKGEFDYIPHYLERSQSCPDLTLYRNPNSPTLARKRAMSECYKHSVMQKTQSETELEKIDKERTFKPSDAFMQQKNLILKFFDALSLAAAKTQEEKIAETKGVHGFSDAEILSSEKVEGMEIVPSFDPKSIPKRRRAVSDFRPPTKDFNLGDSVYTWYGNDAAAALREFRKRRALSTVGSGLNPEKQTLFQRIKHKLKFKDQNEPDIEKQTLESNEEKRRPSILEVMGNKSSFGHDPILEQTSVADMLRVLTNIALPAPEPKRKLGTASLTPPQAHSPKQRRTSFAPTTRRTSLTSTKNELSSPRRFSLLPVTEGNLASSSSFVAETRNSFRIRDYNGRKFSIRPATNISTISVNSPVRTQVNRKKRTDTDR